MSNPLIWGVIKTREDFWRNKNVYDENESGDYAITGATGPAVNILKQVGQPTLKLRLELAQKRAEAHLATIKEARELLDRHPDLERLMDIMQRNHF